MFRIFLQETFVIEDYLVYIQSYTSTDTKPFANFPNVSNYICECTFNSPVTRNNRVELGAYQTSGTLGIGFSYGNQALTGYTQDTSEHAFGNTVKSQSNTDYSFVFERRGTNVILKYNNNTLASTSVPLPTADTISVRVWSANTIIKNLKVKAL